MIDQDTLNAMLIEHSFWLKTQRREGKKLVLKGNHVKGLRFNAETLAYADFSGSIIHDCSFVGAYLYKATLIDTLIYDSDLSGCNFMGASINSLRISGCDLDHIKNMMIMGPMGSREDWLYIVRHLNREYKPYLMFKTGCFCGRLGSFRKAVREKYRNKNWFLYRSYFGAMAVAQNTLLPSWFPVESYKLLDSVFEKPEKDEKK